MSKVEKEEWLKSMGYVIKYLLKTYEYASNYELLNEIYEQQYQTATDVLSNNSESKDKNDNEDENPVSE